MKLRPDPRSKDHLGRDALTGLVDRRSLFLDLERSFAESAVGYVAIFNLDDFAYVNHLLGHRAGDALLPLVAKIIREAAGPARTYRLGGDDFVVLGAGLDLDAARMFHRRVRDAVRVPLTTESCPPGTPPNLTITVSGGVSAWPDPAHAAWCDVLRAADVLLLGEKQRSNHDGT